MPDLFGCEVISTCLHDYYNDNKYIKNVSESTTSPKEISTDLFTERFNLRAFPENHVGNDSMEALLR